MKLLALDLDGVISDSAPESFVVALKTYAELFPGSAIDGIRAQIDASQPSEVREDPTYLHFVELMPLGNRAEDFGVALSILVSGGRVETQAEYDGVRDAAGEDFLSSFHERFYQVRRRLREADPARWAELLGPYPRFVEILKRRGRETTLALATAKDRESATLLLGDYGLAGLIPGERVLDKEAGRDKQAHLRALQQRTGISFGDITFIDDKVNHLEAVAPLGVRCGLAAWGYNGTRQQREAERLGYLVCTLEDVEAKLFD